MGSHHQGGGVPVLLQLGGLLGIAGQLEVTLVRRTCRNTSIF